MNKNKLINEVAQKIINGVNPDKIVLFGSSVENKTNPDSDIDILVIKDTNTRRDERDKEIRSFLKGIIFPMDIFVYTKEEVEKYKHFQGSFIKKILDTGRVIYERKC